MELSLTASDYPDVGQTGDQCTPLFREIPAFQMNSHGLKYKVSKGA